MTYSKSRCPLSPEKRTQVGDQGPQRSHLKHAAKDEMIRAHHRLNGHELGQTPGDSGGQGSPACCSPWSHKELDTAEWLNSNKGFMSLIWRLLPKVEL